jgi:hypothetical protein
MRDHLAPLLERIRKQLEVRAADPVVLTEMEHTLTDGYARALQLEAERLRLERRIGELAHSLEGPEQADELRELAARLRNADDDLAGLRSVLGALQRRVDSRRAAA